MHIVPTLCLLSMLAASSAMSAQTDVFEFDSGLSHHPEGFGAWRARWDESGFAITHQVRDRVTDYPKVSLAPEDEAALRARIEEANLRARGNILPSAAPGRAFASFRVGSGGDVKPVRVWVDWDREDDSVVRLIRKIGKLIEKHTGVMPVLRS